MDPVLSSGDMASVAGGYVFPVRRNALITISVTSMPPAGCPPALRIVGRNALPRHPSDAGPTASRISDIVDRIPLRSSLPVLLDRHRVVPLGPELVEHGRELLDAGLKNGAPFLFYPHLDGGFVLDIIQTCLDRIVPLRPELVEHGCELLVRNAGG